MKLTDFPQILSEYVFPDRFNVQNRKVWNAKRLIKFVVECWIDSHRFHNNSTAIPPSWIAEGNSRRRLLLEEWKTRAFQAEPGNSIYRDRQSVFQPRFINSRPRDNRAKSRGQGDGSRSANNARNGRRGERWQPRTLCHAEIVRAAVHDGAVLEEGCPLPVSRCASCRK